MQPYPGVPPQNLDWRSQHVRRYRSFEPKAASRYVQTLEHPVTPLKKIHQKACPRFRSVRNRAVKSAVTPSVRFDIICGRTLATVSPPRRIMKLSITLVAALLCAAAPALAQAPAQHQPGVTSQHQAPAPAAVSPAAPPSLSEKVDPAKEAAIRHLMDITETSKLGDNINAFLTDRIRTIMSRNMTPDKLPKFMDSFTQKFSAASPSSAVADAVVPIYARAFTMEDIQEMTKFYESSVGQ
ncbi:MAG TPA: DUF2059 domain-containing protein, partial [Acidisoma sp.]|nr:DUF2059 domain-containing protein [Acidisoma sp.]